MLFNAYYGLEARALSFEQLLHGSLEVQYFSSMGHLVKFCFAHWFRASFIIELMSFSVELLIKQSSSSSMLTVTSIINQLSKPKRSIVL